MTEDDEERLEKVLEQVTGHVTCLKTHFERNDWTKNPPELRGMYIRRILGNNGLPKTLPLKSKLLQQVNTLRCSALHE